MTNEAVVLPLTKLGGGVHWVDCGKRAASLRRLRRLRPLGAAFIGSLRQELQVEAQVEGYSDQQRAMGAEYEIQATRYE